MSIIRHSMLTTSKEKKVSDKNFSRELTTIKSDLANFKKKQIAIWELKNPLTKLRIQWEFNNILDTWRKSKLKIGQKTLSKL